MLNGIGVHVNTFEDTAADVETGTRRRFPNLIGACMRREIVSPVRLSPE